MRNCTSAPGVPHHKVGCQTHAFDGPRRKHWAVALHVDGYRWHHQRERFERDARQRTRLAARGWSSLIVTRGSLESGEWLEALARLLAERAPQLSLAV